MKTIILILATLIYSRVFSQDLMEHLLEPKCGTTEAVQFCSQNFSTYFPMDYDTLHAIVVFVNYSNGNYDPANINQDLILLQHWPANQNQYLLKPSWADSIICPTTANVWNPSLTGLFAKSSLNKFWLTGDVYDSLVIVKKWEHYRDSGKIGKAVKDAIDKMDPYFDFSLPKYDRFDPCDIDGDGKQKRAGQHC